MRTPKKKNKPTKEQKAAIAFQRIVRKRFFADSEKEKDQVCEQALHGAGLILKLASVFTKSEKFIEGYCTYPDGSVWRLRFERMK